MKKTSITLFLLSSLATVKLALSASVVEDHQPRSPGVHTKYGQVQGRLAKIDGAWRPVYVFKGIPYATPPVGSNRYVLLNKIAQIGHFWSP